jgi:hypothetical protein
MNSEPNITIRVTDKQAKTLRILALMCGYERAQRGSLWKFIQRMGEHAHAPVTINETNGTIDYFLRLSQYVGARHPFRVVYRSESGERVEALISGGFMGVSAVRGYYMVGCSPLSVNDGEIQSLRRNHLIFLRQIIELPGPTNEINWQKVPTLNAKFLICDPNEYRQLDGDELVPIEELGDDPTLPEELRERGGIIVRRQIASTMIFMLEITQYSRCWVLSVELRNHCKSLFQQHYSKNNLFTES